MPQAQADPQPHVLHSFVTSSTTGSHVYTRVELLGKNLFNMEENHLLQGARKALKDDQRLLLIKHPEMISLRPEALVFSPQTVLPDWMACRLQSSTRVEISEKTTELYQTHVLSGSINPACSWLQTAADERVSFSSNNPESQSYPDGLWLLEIPPAELEAESKASVMPELSKAEGYRRLLSGGYGGDDGPWHKFDFKPGGMGSRLLDIDIMFGYLPVAWEEIRQGLPVLALREKQGIRVQVADLSGNQRETFYTWDQVETLMAENDQTTQWLNPLREAHVLIKSDLHENPLAQFSDLAATLQQVREWTLFEQDIQALDTKRPASVPGILQAGNGQQNASGGSRQEEGQQSAAPAASTSSSVAAGGGSGSRSGGEGEGEGEGGDEGGDRRRNTGFNSERTCGASPKKKERSFTYSYRDSESEEFDTEVTLVRQDYELNRYACVVCNKIANAPSECLGCENQCKRQSVVCKHCVRDRCPKCRGWRRTWDHKEHGVRADINKFKAYCPYRAEGCLEEFSIDQGMIHLESCSFNKGVCPHCERGGSRNSVASHMHRDHKGKSGVPQMRCPRSGCGEIIYVTDLQRHLQSGGRSPDCQSPVNEKVTSAESESEINVSCTGASALPDADSYQPPSKVARVVDIPESIPECTGCSRLKGELRELKLKIEALQKQVFGLAQPRTMQEGRSILEGTPSFGAPQEGRSILEGTPSFGAPQEGRSSLERAGATRGTSLFPFPLPLNRRTSVFPPLQRISSLEGEVRQSIMRRLYDFHWTNMNELCINLGLHHRTIDCRTIRYEPLVEFIFSPPQEIALSSLASALEKMNLIDWAKALRYYEKTGEWVEPW